MLSELRASLRSALASIPVSRPPVLRRSLRDDMLFACDLPMVADDASVSAFCQQLTNLGWLTEKDGQWLQLDHELPMPKHTARSAKGELGCVISLLERHPGDLMDRGWIRRIAKAAEEGGPATERIAHSLHSELSERLREKAPLPSLILPLLYQAADLSK